MIKKNVLHSSDKNQITNTYLVMMGSGRSQITPKILAGCHRQLWVLSLQGKQNCGSWMWKRCKEWNTSMTRWWNSFLRWSQPLDESPTSLAVDRVKFPRSPASRFHLLRHVIQDSGAINAGQRANKTKISNVKSRHKDQEIHTIVLAANWKTFNINDLGIPTSELSWGPIPIANIKEWYAS